MPASSCLAVLYFYPCPLCTKFMFLLDPTSFSLSICDIVQSFALLLGPLMIPSNVENSWGVGNDVTCQINAVALTLGSTGMFSYFCFLCLYYLCKLKYRMQNDAFRQKIELRIHLLIATLNVLLVGTALGLNTFHTALNRSFCHFAATPLYCRDSPEVVGQCDPAVKGHVDLFILVNVFIFNIITFCSIFAIMVMLYRHANSLKKMSRGITTSRTSTMIAANSDNNKNDRENDKDVYEHGSMCEFQDNINDHEGGRKNNVGGAGQTHSRSSNNNNIEQNAQEMADLYRKEIVRQATLYVGVYLLSCVPLATCFLLLVANSDSTSINIVLLIVATSLYPNAGLFISLAFFRPKVALIRRNFPECSRVLALWLVLRAGGEVPDLENLNIPKCCYDNTVNNGITQEDNYRNETYQDDNMELYGMRITGSRSMGKKLGSRSVGKKLVVSYPDLKSGGGVDGFSQSLGEDDVKFNPKSNWSYVEGDGALDAIDVDGGSRSNNKPPSDLSEDLSLWTKTVEGMSRFVSSVFGSSDEDRREGREGRESWTNSKSSR